MKMVDLNKPLMMHKLKIIFLLTFILFVQGRCFGQTRATAIEGKLINPLDTVRVMAYANLGWKIASDNPKKACNGFTAPLR